MAKTIIVTGGAGFITVFKDDRGYFFESFNQQAFETAIGEQINFVQDNQSFSQYGTLRGLHFQKGEWAQAKLVRVITGKVLDVAVDIRPSSPTFGQWGAVELSEDNFKQLFLPRGFAHGFVVLSSTATFAYKCDNYYHKPAEGAIKFDDESLNIQWTIPVADVLLSEKDALAPSWKTLKL